MQKPLEAEDQTPRLSRRLGPAASIAGFALSLAAGVKGTRSIPATSTGIGDEKKVADHVR